MPMGVLAPGSAHARPSAQPPIDVSRNFPAHMVGVHNATSLCISCPIYPAIAVLNVVANMSVITLYYCLTFAPTAV